MMNLPIFMCMLFALQLIYWIVGRYTSKGVVDKQDYFLAKKSVQFFPLMMTFVGVIVGGGVVLGSAEEAYLYGWPVFFYPLGGALGLMALGTGIGRRLAQFPVSTVAQICEVTYGASLFTTIFLFCLGYVLYFEPAIVSLPLPQMEDWVAVSPKLTGWLLMPLFFMVIEQDIAQRCFAGSSPKIVTRAAFAAGICTLIISIVPVFFGVLAKSIQLEVPKGGSVLMSANRVFLPRL